MMFEKQAGRFLNAPTRLRLAVLAICLGGALPVSGQTPAPAPSESPPPGATPPVETFDEKLIRILQKHNAISRSDAEELIRAAREEQAKEAQARQAATAPVPPAPAPPPTPNPALVPQPGDVHVHLIPESEKRKMEEEVTSKVLETERTQNYGRPEAYPDWLNRISFFGDFRFRQQYDYYQRNNAPFINFNLINSGSPFDVSEGNTALPPTVDDTVNREQPRIRLRLGMNAQVNDLTTTTFRFASGNTTNPVSTNQTLGSDFNKYTFVIDQAYVDFHPPGLTADLGRLPKPFVSTNLVFWDDLSFDGLAARYQYQVTDWLQPFITGGAFSVENTALDFPTYDIVKDTSRDKWLYSGQLGFNVRFGDFIKSTTAVAYYAWHNIEGVTSSPCLATTAAIPCSSDDTRPGFLQKGNTLFEIRDLVPNPSNPNGPQYQYFGLASKFDVLDVVSIWDVAVDGDRHVVFTGDFAKNLAFHAPNIASLNPVNNIGSNGKWQGGSKAFQLQMLVGYPVLTERWQWNVLGGYKRVESDSVVDAFDDPDFFQTQGVGGTNDKGYFIFGSLDILKRVWIQGRYFSAQEITGPPLRVDTVQLDLNTNF
jgi:hypothetical protein